MKASNTNLWECVKASVAIPLAAVAVVAFANPQAGKTEAETIAIRQQDNKIHDVVEQMPQFPGGVKALMEYLSKSTRYPAEAERNGESGRVTVAFVVNRDGSISDTEILKSVSPLLDKEAMRVVNAMPNWLPGMRNGKPVRVKYFVPVAFRLDRNEKRTISGTAPYKEASKGLPLIVIDGKPISETKYRSLDDIKPNAIKSITVLKNESEAEKYGEEGRNGVIVVTTKGK